MCTVTYLPKENSSYILTHNRDEHHTRGIALLPEKKIFHQTEVIAPTDPKAGGTWFAISGNYTLCLLNGGFTKHKHAPPYRQSRGFVIPDFFQTNQVKGFLASYNVQNMEPFTLLIVENEPLKIHQIVLENGKLFHEEKPVELPYIWSSSTLYTPADSNRRKKYFERFVLKNEINQQSAINFHTNQFEEYTDEGIQINRNEILKTVSVISVDKRSTAKLYYEDLLQKKKINLEF